MRFETLNSEDQYQGRAFSVRRDAVRLPNGKTTKLDVVVHSGAVTILPVDENGDIWFVRQYRHPAGLEILELPAGTLEDGEDPVACAHREIQEEIGMRATNLEKIGQFFLAPGYSTEFMHVYLATDLSPSSLPADEDEFLNVEKYAVDRAFEMVQNGEIQDAKTLATFFLARVILQTND